jgi:hypothetical protein
VLVMPTVGVIRATEKTVKQARCLWAFRWDETAGLANQINLFAALGVQKETSQ